MFVQLLRKKINIDAIAMSYVVLTLDKTKLNVWAQGMEGNAIDS